MGFFNLVETFFFISLAITFVLIMMLIYHFKDRLTTLETKSETILEIINNLLKENSVLKSGYLQIIQSIQNSRIPQQEQQHPVYNRILVSEDDEDSDDDVDEYDSADDSGSEEDSEEPVIKQIQIHGGFNANIHDIADIDELDGIDNIDNLDFERTANELDDLEVDITEKESEEEVLEVDISEPEIGVEEIIVTKLEEIIDDNLRESSESNTISENNFIQPVEVYRKMDIGELRSLVIQKGLATDTKKLKKMDLIRLLTLSQGN